MSAEIRFPPHLSTRVHYRYMHNLLVDAGCAVQIDPGLRRLHRPSFTPSTQPGPDGLSFEFGAKGQQIVVDYANAAAVRFDVRHLKYQSHGDSPPAVPFTKVSFLDWPEARRLWAEVQYSACGGRVLANWRMTGRKIRPMIAALLTQEFGASRVDTEWTEQSAWWRKFARCLVYVQVPGYNNHILDRGQVQAMAFGVCVISPRIPDLLAHGAPLVPGEHYLQCQDDYADLPGLVRWCESHRHQCRLIGQAAKELFMRTSTPDKLWAWIQETML